MISMDPDEIPKQVRYDFFLTLLGTIIMLYVGYVWMNNPSEQLTSSLFFGIGYIIFLLGIKDLREDFVMDYNIKRLKYEKDYFDLCKELTKRKIHLKRISLMKVREK